MIRFTSISLRAMALAAFGTAAFINSVVAEDVKIGTALSYKATSGERSRGGDTRTDASEQSLEAAEIAAEEPKVMTAPKKVVKKLKPIDPVYQSTEAIEARRILEQSAKNDADAEVDPTVTGAISGCSNATKKYDSDIRRNLSLLKDACIELHSVKDGNRNWKIYTIKSKKRGPLWAVVHDNENSAFDGAAKGLKTHGGTIVAIETGEKRNFRGKDPNRNFGRKCGNARNYTKFMMNLVSKTNGVISLHSNANGFSGGGGSGHISIRRKSRVLIAYPSKVAKGNLKDEDTFILLPGKGDINARIKNKIKRLNKKGIHAMYERVTKAGNDCSMSNHMVLTNRGSYVTIEVEHGKSGTARKLVPVAKGLL